jgi:hypothetical protein
MKQIFIRRTGNTVTFDTVNIDNTENVFFTNLDTEQSHWPAFDPNGASPDFCDDQLFPAPSDNSSQCIVPEGQSKVTYGCRIAGHSNEQGVINVFEPLAPDATTINATTGEAANTRVVQGGMAPYTITGLIINNADCPGTCSGPGDPLPIGCGLVLAQDANGISVLGTATESGTFKFTFTVDDSMGRNLQQVQYSVTIS